MAATLAASRLTQAHRVAQARLGARTVARMALVWPLLDLADLDGSSPRWLTAAEAVVAAERQASAALAGEYLRGFRAVELGDADPTFAPAPADPLDPRRLRTSLLVTGPVRLKQAIALHGRVTGDEVAASAGAAQRHALNGGRSATLNTVAADPEAKGWARRARPNACPFCLMLVARGPVYSGDDFRSHDACGCTLEPVYRGDGWTPEARDLADTYDRVRSDLGYGASAADMRRAFADALQTA